MSRRRELRRMAGMLKARLPELGLARVSEPRAFVRRWQLNRIVRAAVLGVMSGCKSFAELEELTASLSRAIRRELGLPGRLPDTTARDVFCRLQPDELRSCLHRAVKAAQRRKALQPQGLPFHVVALDGKATSLPCWDFHYAQRHIPEYGAPFGLLRTVTCSLVSAPGRPCIDAVPLPAHTNEMGHFQSCFAALCETYGELFRVVTYDAGVSSEANARAVVEAEKDYLFRLRNENRYMYRMADELLDPDDVAAQTVDVLDNRTTIVRKLVLTAVQSHWSYGRNRYGAVKPHESIWEHTRTLLRVESEKWVDGRRIDQQVRFYNSSLKHDAITAEQWLQLIRSHWGVENNNHHTLDVAFAEDDRPWIKANPQGTLAVLILRRIAYTLLTLFRSVTQRSDDKRAIAWNKLLRWAYRTLVGAHEADLDGLRPRKNILALG